MLGQQSCARSHKPPRPPAASKNLHPSFPFKPFSAAVSITELGSKLGWGGVSGGHWSSLLGLLWLKSGFLQEQRSHSTPGPPPPVLDHPHGELFFIIVEFFSCCSSFQPSPVLPQSTSKGLALSSLQSLLLTVAMNSPEPPLLAEQPNPTASDCPQPRGAKVSQQAQDTRVSSFALVKALSMLSMCYDTGKCCGGCWLAVPHLPAGT